MEIDSYTKDNVKIVETDPDRYISLPSGSIMVNRTYDNKMRENNEITLALQKRFKNKRTLHGDPGFADIVVWCLSTDYYKISQENFNSISNSDVDLS